MTIIGRDRPGLVDLVAKVVMEHGGNWLESRMSHLSGQFAGILRIDVPADRQQSLIASLLSLEAQGLKIVVHPGTPERPSESRALAELHLMGHDRPGIVCKISHCLAQNNVNVEELKTECSSAAMSGDMLFKTEAKLQLPDGLDVNALRQSLEKIAGDLMVDVTLSEKKPSV